mmetsp:Transcript_16496/g.42334  ORF Transcript_16496/g.42334 Transcript_16496/m.42334 type:complete len:92 (-) Transcript_16496:1195-1470(-)
MQAPSLAPKYTTPSSHTRAWQHMSDTGCVAHVPHGFSMAWLSPPLADVAFTLCRHPDYPVARCTYLACSATCSPRLHAVPPSSATLKRCPV